MSEFNGGNYVFGKLNIVSTMYPYAIILHEAIIHKNKNILIPRNSK